MKMVPISVLVDEADFPRFQSLLVAELLKCEDRPCSITFGERGEAAEALHRRWLKAIDGGGPAEGLMARAGVAPSGTEAKEYRPPYGLDPARPGPGRGG